MKPGWWVLGAGVAGLLLWFGAPPILRHVDFFNLRRLELAGARYLRVEEVAGLIEWQPGASIFDPIEGIAERVRELPGVLDARVSRRLPGTLRVEVDEADPVALGRRDGRLVLLDRAARVLPFDPTRAPQDLPILPVDSMVAGVVAFTRDAEPSVYDSLTGAERLPGGVALEVGGRRYVVRMDVTSQEMRAMKAVAQDLMRQGRTFRELDGRFRGRILVRGRGA